MRKVLLMLTITASLGMLSCADDAKEEGKDSSEKTVNPLDEMCSCAGDMMELGKQYQEDIDNKELMIEFQNKAKECEGLGKSLEKGKSEDEIETMKKEFMESCDAIKEMN